MKGLNLICCFFVLLCCAGLHAQDNRTNGVVEDNSDLAPGEDPDEKIRKNFFLRADVSKTECFVGEPVMAIFKAYSRLDANSQVLKRPSLSGFSVIEMVDAYNNQPDIERFNGKNYFVHLIRKVQLFPLQAGTFTIEPAEVESVIHLRKSNKSINNIRDIFRRRQNDNSLDRQVVFKTSPVTIRVNPLPEKERPEDYAGAVGDFIVQMIMSDTVIAARDPVIVKLIISGTGNFPLVTAPNVDWPAGAEISGPSMSEQMNKYIYPLSGVKAYQYTVEHRDTGTYTIPAVRLSYFDAKSSSYKVAESKALTYTVTQATELAKPQSELIFRNEKQRPLHYYYFGAIALLIIGIIVYFMVRPAKKTE